MRRTSLHPNSLRQQKQVHSLEAQDGDPTPSRASEHSDAGVALITAFAAGVMSQILKTGELRDIG